LCWAAAAVIAAGAFSAQESPPTYKADPDVFKLVFEDTSFRIISATWQPGQTDEPHSHLAVSVAVPDGKFAYINERQGRRGEQGRHHAIAHNHQRWERRLLHLIDRAQIARRID